MEFILIDDLIEPFIPMKMTGNSWQVSLATTPGLHQICVNTFKDSSVTDIFQAA